MYTDCCRLCCLVTLLEYRANCSVCNSHSAHFRTCELCSLESCASCPVWHVAWVHLSGAVSCAILESHVSCLVWRFCSGRACELCSFWSCRTRLRPRLNLRDLQRCLLHRLCPHKPRPTALPLQQHLLLLLLLLLLRKQQRSSLVTGRGARVCLVLESVCLSVYLFCWLVCLYVCLCTLCMYLGA